MMNEKKWYCPKCNKSIEHIEPTKMADFRMCLDCYTKVNELRIKITGIRKERLLDISEEDAKKEGFENKLEFLWSFCEIAKINSTLNFAIKYLPPEIKQDKKFKNDAVDIEVEENPFVWCLDFEVKK